MRSLRFPDASIGTLFVREASDADWRAQGPALGRVELPDGADAKLEAGPEFSFFGAFDELAPDDLRELDLTESRPADPAAIAKVARLSGLTSLELRRTGIDDDAVAELVPLARPTRRPRRRP